MSGRSNVGSRSSGPMEEGATCRRGERWANGLRSARPEILTPLCALTVDTTQLFSGLFEVVSTINTVDAGNNGLSGAPRRNRLALLPPAANPPRPIR